jgi:hypothetical protein
VKGTGRASDNHSKQRREQSNVILKNYRAHVCPNAGQESLDDDPHVPVYGKYYALILEREDVAEKFKAVHRGIHKALPNRR